jgi:biofilm PGA synthesis lipoprotein PgaB
MRWLRPLLLLSLWMPVSALGLEYDVIAYHDVRDDVAGEYDSDRYAISTEHLIAHFRWLQQTGFTPISVDAILDAEAGRTTLPDKPVLLSFDDGLQSFYTRVFPLLKLFDYPAVVSVVSSWIEMDGEVDYDGGARNRHDFLTWDQLREMQASGLVEIASHTHSLHEGIPGNPQGNLQPAAVTRRFADRRYEDETSYRARVARDLATSIATITRETGQAPRVITWPYGAFNQSISEVAESLGMRLSLTLEPDNSRSGNLLHRGRLLIVANPSIADLSAELLLPGRAAVLRIAQIDLDYLYDPDPVQQEANLGRLLDRIKELGLSHVFLQAFADPDGDGGADAVYFPNRHLPVRADLFNRVAWQLKTRADVRVYAWMPMLSFVGDPFAPDWYVAAEHGTAFTDDPNPAPRLSPFHGDAKRLIAELYEDLARYSKFDGILFHDDGRLGETEDFSDAAIAAYRDTFGSVPGRTELKADPDLRRRFAAFKTGALIDLSHHLTEQVRRQLPHVRTARNIFASALLDSTAAVYLAQDFDAFRAAYDHVALLAMPGLEGADDQELFFRTLVDAVAVREGGLDQTIFELQTIDWNDGTRIPGHELFQTMRWLQSLGVRHIGYYPDDFIRGHPELQMLRQGISLADHFREGGQ